MTVRKKGNKWYCRFQLDGVRYERRCALASNEREALQIESIIKAEIMHGNYNYGIAEKTATLKEGLKIFENYSKCNKLSYKSDIAHINIALDFFGANCPLKNIAPDKIEDFKNYLKSSKITTKIKTNNPDYGKKGVRKKYITVEIETVKTRTNATINRHIEMLSKMFNLCIENKLIDKNPCTAVKSLREDNHKIRFLTKDEEIRLFNAIDETNRHIEPILICALQTGMRKGEIFGLLKSCVDLKGGYLELLKTKSGKARKIPISDKLRPILINALTDKSNASEYVFINPETGTKYDNIKRSFRTLLKKADIENFRFHDFRHTAATRMVEAGIDLAVVQEILGHSSIQTTMRYAHPVPERKKQAIDVLNNF